MSAKKVNTSATNALEIVECEETGQLREMDAICYVGGSFYCFGGGTVEKSQNLMKWKEMCSSFDLSPFEDGHIANDVYFKTKFAFTPGQMIKKTADQNALVYTKDFTDIKTIKLPSKKTLEFISVLYFNGEYHFITNKIIFRTKDLTNFDQYFVEERYEGVIESATCNSKVIMLTIWDKKQKEYRLLRSKDGRDYETCSAEPSSGWPDLYTLADTIHMGMGDSGTVSYTTDGGAWSETSLDFTINTDRIVKQGDVTFFRAELSEGNHYELYATRNGVDFVKIPVKQENFDWFAYDGERLVLATDGGRYAEKASLYTLKFGATGTKPVRQKKPKATGLAAQDFVKLFDEGELTNKQIRELLVAFADTLRAGE